MLTVLRLSLFGLVVAVFCLASPCQALIDIDPDVSYHPAAGAASDPFFVGDLGKQIEGTAVTVSGIRSTPENPVTPSDYYADSHTAVFGDLKTSKAGKTGIFTLDQFNQLDELGQPRLIDGNPIGKLQGMLLYITMHLKSGRKVADNESNMVVEATVGLFANLRVHSTDTTIGIDPLLIDSSLVKTGHMDPDKGGSYDGRPPTDLATLGQDEIDKWSYDGLSPDKRDKLTVVIDPNDENANYRITRDVYLDGDVLDAFVGTGTVEFGYIGEGYLSDNPENMDVVSWGFAPRYDIEARVVYLYAAVPEPASMGLLAAAFAPLLVRRLRKRKTRLS